MKLRTATFYLRGGHAISVKCEDVEITREPVHGAYSGYKIIWGDDNPDRPSLFTAALPDIVALLVTK